MLFAAVLAGVALFITTPMTVHPGLLDVPNAVLTPHIGSASLPTRRAMANLAVDNLIATLGSGAARRMPPTALNPEVLGRGSMS